VVSFQTAKSFFELSFFASPAEPKHHQQEEEKKSTEKMRYPIAF
jgi:hypothetical protein